MKEPLVTIIIPTFNNQSDLSSCLRSILRNYPTPGLFKILVINNGHPNSCDYLKGQKDIQVITSGQNLGWEGGIELGLKNSSSPLVCFLNDDTLLPPSSRLWLNQMVQHFRDPAVAAVGPASNVVMGAQNIFSDIPYHVFRSTFIIGFCALIRRSAFEQIGGMDMTLPGGDDLDWSIRLRKAGYNILIDRTVFMYHHGFRTGERVYGDSRKLNGWNSFEQTDKTNQALIKKHGLKEWWDTISKQVILGDLGQLQADSEGNVIRKLVKKQEKTILDIGCGPRKTIKRSIGVDFIKRGERITALGGNEISDADVEANVAENLPFEDNSVDVIIGRHILEHMVDHISVLMMWMRRLKPGGRLILALPNEDWHLTIPMNIEHCHTFNPKNTQVLLTALGLNNIKFHQSGNNISFIVEGTK